MCFANLVTEGYRLTNTNYYTFKHIIEAVFQGTFEFFIVQREELPYYFVDTPKTVCVVRYSPEKKSMAYHEKFELREGDKILTSNIHTMIDHRIITPHTIEDVYHWIHDELGLMAFNPYTLKSLKDALACLFEAEFEEDESMIETAEGHVEEHIIANLMANPFLGKHIWVHHYGLNGELLEDWLKSIPGIESCYEEGPFGMKGINRGGFLKLFEDTLHRDWKAPF